MIVALLLGREGSVGFPGKNTYPVLGRPLAFYPMNVAKQSSEIDLVYLSTNDPKLKQLAKENAIEIIVRPESLCTKEALGEDAFVHGYREIQSQNPTKKIEFLVLLFCNAATITSEKINEGLSILRQHPEYDSAVSVSRYNMWSPLRARKKGNNGLMQPFIPFTVFGDPRKLNCDRDSQGDVFFADMGVSIIRPSNIEQIEQGLLPQKWMGQNIYPLEQDAGCDVDYEWQIPVTEWWLKKYGGY